MNRFAISDIHGCLHTFKLLLEKIHFSKADELYLLGDYIDRGPDSKGVIDHIWKLQTTGYTIYCLKGNHEQMMLDALTSLPHRRQWMVHGGRTTMSSFGVQHLSEIPNKYTDWLRALPHYKEIKGYILVHAGLNFSKSNPLDDQTSMLWVRRWYDLVDREWLNGRIIVHGHTPIKRAMIESMLDNLEHLPVIDIDGGCVFVEPVYQELCAFDLNDRVLHFQRREEN